MAQRVNMLRCLMPNLQPQVDLVSQYRIGKSYSGRLSSDLLPFSDMCSNPMQKKHLDFNEIEI